MSFEHVFAVLRNPKVGDKISFTVELENRENVFLVLSDEIGVGFTTTSGIVTMLTHLPGGKQLRQNVKCCLQQGGGRVHSAYLANILLPECVGCVDDDGKSYFDDGSYSNSIISMQKTVNCGYERILTRADIDNEIWSCTVSVKAASLSSGKSACIETGSASRCTHAIEGGWVNDHAIVATKVCS